MTKEILLHNKTREVVGKALVDDSDYENLNQYCWHLDKRYARSNISGKMIRMHRFIMNAEKGELIDHIDSNGLNNTRNNLRRSNVNANRHNRIKAENTASKFKGVSLMRPGSKRKWKAMCAAHIIGVYLTEEDAAWAYDDFCKTKYGDLASINNVVKPSSFQPYERRIKKSDSSGTLLPKNICFLKSQGVYVVCITRGDKYFCRTFHSLSEAITAKNLFLTEVENSNKDSEILNHPLRNEEGVAQIPITHKGQVLFTLVDDDVWERIKNLRLTYFGGYVQVFVNGVAVSLGRYVMETSNPNILVDHINHDPLENRRSNLREATHAQNSANRKKCEGTSSKFIGVCMRGAGKWEVQVGEGGKQIYFGTYENELVAAWVFDMNAKRIHGEFASLNNVPAPTGYVMLDDGKAYLETDITEDRKAKLNPLKNISQSREKFQVGFRVSKKLRYFGSYDSLEVAQWVRDQAAVELYGPDTKLINVPNPQGWTFKDHRGVYIGTLSEGEKTNGKRTRAPYEEIKSKKIKLS